MSHRTFPGSVFLCVSLLLCGAISNTKADPFTPPASPRVTLNFNPGWKFIKQDVPGADAPGFDDSKWVTVSTPHTYNDVDSYADFISHSHGEDHPYMGIAWYRKHFKLPQSA